MLFKNSVRTSKRTPHFTITKINWLTLSISLFSFKWLIDLNDCDLIRQSSVKKHYNNTITIISYNKTHDIRQTAAIRECILNFKDMSYLKYSVSHVFPRLMAEKM
jgi:hypothetical protein